MNTTRTTRLVAVAIQAQVPVFRKGPPGCGKSMNTYAVCRALHRPMKVLIGSAYQPEDLASGFPVADLAAGYVRMLHNKVLWGDLQEDHVIFLDEITTLEGRQHAVLLRPLNEGYIGEYKLPAGLSWVLAGNDPAQVPGGHDLLAATANRIMHLDEAIDGRVTATDALAGWPDPDVPRLPMGWDGLIDTVQSTIASYLLKRPDRMHVMPKDALAQGAAWPTQRSWFGLAARMLAACESCGLAEEEVIEALAGCVGRGAAVELLTWRRELDLADPEELLEKWKTFKLPKTGDKQFATLASIVSVVVRQLTQERFNAAWQIMAAAASQGSPDVAASGVRALIRAGSRAKMTLPMGVMEPFKPMLKRVGRWPDAGTPGPA